MGRRDKKRKTTKTNSKERRRKVRALRKRDGNNCWICHEPMPDDTDPPTIDHMIPRVCGGTEALTNLRLAHAKCNNDRSNPPIGRPRTSEDTVVINEQAV